VYSTNEQDKISKLEQKIEELTKENEGLKLQDQKSGVYAKYLDSIPSVILAVDKGFTVTFLNKFAAKNVMSYSKQVTVIQKNVPAQGPWPRKP
jgi:hypothetical protein